MVAVVVVVVVKRKDIDKSAAKENPAYSQGIEA